jgi:hypothetical protein
MCCGCCIFVHVWNSDFLAHVQYFYICEALISTTTKQTVIIMRAIFLLLLLLVFLYTSEAKIHSCANCRSGLLCCNDLNSGKATCYDPAVYQCNNGNRLCPKGYLSCGRACYLPTIYQCNSGNRLCPLGFLSCGNSCYSPSQYACSSNNQLVNKCVPGICGNLLCCPANGGCYNPNHLSCQNSGLFVRCLGIPSNDPSVCNGHGVCDGLDVCKCTNGWSGPNCFTPPP